MTTLPELLQALHKAAPEVCKYTDDTYYIGDYAFWIDNDKIHAWVDGIKSVTGQPAMDWLQCALQRGIEGMGWHWSLDRYKNKNSDSYVSSIDVDPNNINTDIYQVGWNDGQVFSTPAEALLAALIAAKGE